MDVTQASDHHNLSADDDPLVGTLFAERYEILQLLGRGGMGCVYKALNRINGQTRAIKVMHRHLALDTLALQRFQTEGKAAQRIDHPNAIKIIDVNLTTVGQPFLVMEFVNGISLSEILKKQGSLPIALAGHIFRQICGALDYAHNEGVVHRDIKPSNVMIFDTAEDRYAVKVVDFGIAKVFPQSTDGTVVETATGEIFGSPPYMSPEQCLGEKLDSRSDIYSLGCLMYEVLSGKPPLVGDSPMSTMYRQINDIPEPLARPDEDIRLVQQFNQIISRAMQKDRVRRYQSVSDLLGDINSASTSARQKSSLVSSLQLSVQRLDRYIHNSLGSSRKAVAYVLGSMALLMLVGTVFIAKYVTMRTPDASQLLIPWQVPPQSSTRTVEIRYAFLMREKKLTADLHKSLADNGGRANPESIWLQRQLGDLYFEDGIFSVANAWYSQVIKGGNQIIANAIANNQVAPSIGHDLAVAYTRYSESLVRQKNFRYAYTIAKASLPWAFKDDNKEDGYKIFVNQVLAVSTSRLGGPGDVVNVYSDNFLNYIEKNGLERFKALEVAPALAELGDCHFAVGKWKKAEAAYKQAREAWLLLRKKGYAPLQGKGDAVVQEYWKHADFGDFNAAVCDDKIAATIINLDRDSEAIALYAKAGSEFEQLGGKDDVNKAKVLFKEADLLWKHRDYANALRVRIEAVKVWLHLKERSEKP